MTNDTSPHENEYLAAIAALPEHTPSRTVRHEPAVGDFVSGVTAGKRWSGHVTACDGGWLEIDCDGVRLSVSCVDITH